MHRKPFKVGLIFLGCFLINLLISCWGDCPKDIVEFENTGITLQNVDNTGSYARVMTDSAMAREAIAFRVNCETNLYDVTACNFKPFNQCYAFSRNCEPDYIARQHVSSIQILTLLPIFDTIPENGDVTNLFLATAINITSLNTQGLYDSIPEVTNAYHDGGIFQNSFVGFDIFLSKTPETDAVQFFISLQFDDGTELSATTQKIYLY